MRKFKTMKIMLIGIYMLAVNFAHAQVKPIVEGVDYTILAAAVDPKIEPKGKINVKEFFSFSCPFCKAAEPFVDASLVPNKSIDLERVQVVWDDTTATYAKLNATLAIMNITKMYPIIFNEVKLEQGIEGKEYVQGINQPNKIKALFASNGYNETQINKIMATYNSFSVSTKVAQYKTMMTTYNINSTPTFIVADKYIVSAASPARLVEVVQQLVNKLLQNKK
jgi:thiol:disulfide interchange protein DsbA